MYGLKQASRQWHNHLTKCSRDMGFEQFLADSCIFRLMEDSRVIITIVGDKDRCDEFGVELNKMVPVKNLGD